jgi:bacteriocin resistance YdeI/OmpD-like protein
MELLKKLRINTDGPLWLINAPDNCLSLFDEVVIKERLSGKKPVGQLVLFAIDSKELSHYLQVVSPFISPETLFWICYPKKSGAITSDLIRMEPWDAVFQSGHRPQTSASVNDDWTGLRVTNAPPKKPSTYNIPAAERKIAGIDFVKRTVQLPPDALAVVNKYSGMHSFFNSMSFTGKKEIVVDIVGAKKEETRIRRIQKMADTLLQKMNRPGSRK